MRDLDTIFARLSRSAFRRRFRLGPSERAYLRSPGMVIVLEHAAAFVNLRLAPALPPSDGRQTPMRGHPVFVAQHATATCCRACLAKWHAIPAGIEVGPIEHTHVLAAIERWLLSAVDQPAAVTAQRASGRQLQLELPPSGTVAVATTVFDDS